MRPGDLLWWVPSALGSVASAGKEEWLIVLILVMAASAVSFASFLFRDVERAGGSATWLEGLYRARTVRQYYLDERSQHRAARRRGRLRERQRRAAIKRKRR